MINFELWGFIMVDTVETLASKWQCKQRLMFGLETNQILKQSMICDTNQTICRLLDLPVLFNNRLSTVAGKAKLSLGQIHMHSALNDEYDSLYADRFDTFFHELAHFVAYWAAKEHGHSFPWQYSMMQFGFKPNRCYNSNKTPYHKYKDKKINEIADQLPDLF